MPDESTMSASREKLLQKVRLIVPPLLERFHKGLKSHPVKELQQKHVLTFLKGNWVEWQ